MDTIIIENVRCFHSLHRIPIRPITVLVGDNSSGKTTFLAMTRIASHVAKGLFAIDFNEDPFLLGAYDQIATLRGGRAGRSKSFTIGMEADLPAVPDTIRARPLPERIKVTGRFVSSESQPFLERWLLDGSPYRIEVDYSQGSRHDTMTAATPSGRWVEPGVTWRDRAAHSVLPYLFSAITRTIPLAPLSGDPSGVPVRGDFEVLRDLLGRIQEVAELPPYAFAPIRTRPQRTYDRLKDIPHPEGSHIPMILAKTHSSDPRTWKKLSAILNSFGKASGLFSGLEVRRMGREDSDPFQIRVKGTGPAFNLMDVGYGVSQVLPIIVDCIRSEEVNTFLLQQPEVHLHPKAQAELGSFLAVAARSFGKRFIVETHSDHLVDRLRMDVRDKTTTDAKDVIILYFERNRSGVTVHPIELDPYGNLTDVPPGYRQFFLEEERRLLGG